MPGGYTVKRKAYTPQIDSHYPVQAVVSDYYRKNHQKERFHLLHGILHLLSQFHP